MSLDEPTEEQLAAWDARDLKAARWLTVALCAAAALGYGYLTAKSPEFITNVARAAGSAAAVLLLPSILAAVTARSTDKWHYTFLAAFAVIFGLVLLGDFAR